MLMYFMGISDNYFFCVCVEVIIDKTMLEMCGFCLFVVNAWNLKSAFLVFFKENGTNF